MYPDGQRREGKDDDDSWSGPAIKPKRGSSKSQNSDISVEDSWAAADSPVSPRRSAVRVSFKGDKELSEVHDIVSDFESMVLQEKLSYSRGGKGGGVVVVRHICTAPVCSDFLLRVHSYVCVSFKRDKELSEVHDISDAQLTVVQIIAVCVSYILL